MNDAEIQAEIKKINAMSQVEMCERQRSAPCGDPYFVDGPLWAAFNARFQGLGGFTPAISKLTGWER